MYKSADFMSLFKYADHHCQVFEHALILKPEVIELYDTVRIDDYSRIEGGQGVGIGRFTHIASFASILGGGICTIGGFVGIAQGVRIVTGTGHPFVDRFIDQPPEDDIARIQRGRVTIEDYVFIGVNAVILPGVTVGEGAVISAGTVVGKDVPPWSIVAGSPARVIGTRPNFTMEGTSK